MAESGSYSSYIATPDAKSGNWLVASSVTLSAGVNTTVAGSTFVPAITLVPKSINVFDSNGNNVTGLYQERYLQNGNYYDIVLYSVDGVSDLKINVLC